VSSLGCATNLASSRPRDDPNRTIADRRDWPSHSETCPRDKPTRITGQLLTPATILTWPCQHLPSQFRATCLLRSGPITTARHSFSSRIQSARLRLPVPVSTPRQAKPSLVTATCRDRSCPFQSVQVRSSQAIPLHCDKPSPVPSSRLSLPVPAVPLRQAYSCPSQPERQVRSFRVETARQALPLHISSRPCDKPRPVSTSPRDKAPHVPSARSDRPSRATPNRDRATTHLVSFRAVASHCDSPSRTSPSRHDKPVLVVTSPPSATSLLVSFPA